MNLTEQQTYLWHFIVKQHEGQVRKYTGEPYHVHLFSVAQIVSEYVPNTIEVALCHDLLEDTKCTTENLLNTLRSLDYSEGYATSIVQGVMRLTDEYTHEKYPEMNREQRKFQEAYRMGFIGETVQSIKYADIIDNTRSIVKHDLGFAKTYLKECVTLLHRMRKGNIHLYIQACHSIQEGLNKLSKESKDTEVAQLVERIT